MSDYLSKDQELRQWAVMKALEFCWEAKDKEEIFPLAKKIVEYVKGEDNDHSKE